MEECITCGDEYPPEDGETIEETAETEKWGIPTGFICDDCLKDAEDEADDYPDTPIDLSDCATAESAARKLYTFLQELALSMDYSADSVKLYAPEETVQKRDVHVRKQDGEYDPEIWTVSWEGGPTDWATHLTGGESLFNGGTWGNGSSPEVIGLFENSNWVAEPYYSFDIQFTET